MEGGGTDILVKALIVLLDIVNVLAHYCLT